MSHRRNIALAITLIAAFLAPSSAPAADTFKVLLGDSSIGSSSITASYKGRPGFAPDIYLQPCSLTIKSDCIQSLAYQSKTGSAWITLVPDEKIVFPVAGVPRFGSSPDIVVETLTAYAADLSNNFPAGGMSPVYKDTNSSSDTTRYLVQARAQGLVDANGKATWNDLRFEIKPVTVSDYTKMNQFGFPTLQVQPTFQNAGAFKIEVRSKATRNLLSGWFYGRVFQPEVKFTSVSEDESVLQIIGAPIVTPIAQGDISFSDYAALQTSSGSALPTVNPAASVLSFGATYGFVNGSGAMKVWRLLDPVLNKNAATSVSSFSVRTSRNASLLTSLYPQGCLASQSLDGVVSTNATMYNPAPPSYDASDGSLNFEVGSPHLDSSGQVNQGFYSMVVSAKIAKCIWGSDLTNYKATVSIVNDSGTTQVSTSVLKAANDFYNFHISGFTYSTKKISIRLLPVAAPTPSTTPTVKAKPVVKRITCVKGNLKKVVSGVKPVCPKGYKIK
jgi:hypothetical protein